MIMDRFEHTCARSRLPLGVVGAALLVSSCLNDRTVGPAGGSATIAVEATVRGQFQVAQRPELVVVVGYYQNESFFVLRQARLPLDTVLRAYPLQVDIVPCLRDSLRFERGTPSCKVTLVAELRVGGTVVDRRSSGPYDLVAGRKVRSVPVELFAGVSPPILGLPSPAVLVDSALIRYEVDASDADGNLSGLLAVYTDSLAGFAQYLFHSFDPPRGSYTGPIYGFLVPQQVTGLLPRLNVTASDTKGASAAATVTVIQPSANAAPRASAVSGAVQTGGVTVNFTLVDPDTNAVAVEILFRDPALDTSSPNADDLLGRCVAPVTSTNGPKVVTCPTFGASVARAIVIPLDRSGNIGFAGRGVLLPPGVR